MEFENVVCTIRRRNDRQISVVRGCRVKLTRFAVARMRLLARCTGMDELTLRKRETGIELNARGIAREKNKGRVNRKNRFRGVALRMYSVREFVENKLKIGSF